MPPFLKGKIMDTLNFTNIEIRNGNEYRMLINNKIYEKTMFFYPVFKKSVEILGEICSCKMEKDSEQFALYYPNNIIMYCAERGGGKSSAMISFAAALKKLKDDAKEGGRDFNELWGDVSSQYNFTVLDVVDPTTIFEKEIFMRIILSKMFSELKDLWKNQDKNVGNENCNISVRNNILEKFRKCYALVDTIYQHSGEFDRNDDLEELSDLGDSTNLKKEFKELVNCFLEQSNGKSEKSYLVIQIDDADLNTKMAYQIIEDIRKYCIIPNVIVLMAVNMKQMHQIIEQHFVHDFEALFKVSHNADDPITLDDTKDMAARYINKLMPSTHQIHLPKIADFIRNNHSTLKLSYMKKVKGEEEDLLSYCDDGTTDPVIDYQDRLIRLIYKKTGVRLVKTDNYIHNFLPQNMRELSHFLSYFCAMPDLDKRLGFAELFAILSQNCRIDGITTEQAEKELKKRKTNIDAFEQYLVKFWSDINLSRKNDNIISDLSDTVETLKISSALKKCENWIGKKAELSGSGDIPCVSYYSYSNLMDMLSEISKNAMEYTDFDEVYRMVYAVRLLFTIMLHKESLMCVSTKNFERLYRVVNGELWTCYNLPGVKPIGRFKVNYNILKMLNPTIVPNLEKGSNIEDCDVLTECCYLRSQNSSLRIDLRDPEILNALNDIEKRNSQDFIIYDTGVSLFNILTDEKYYCEKMSENDRERLNAIFDLLMNWDVRHCVEKSLNVLSNNNSIEWRKNYLDKIEDTLVNIGLFHGERGKLSGDQLKNDVPICLSNREVAIQTVTREINYMKENISSIPSDIQSYSPNSVAQILAVKNKMLIEIDNSFSKIEPLSAISKTIIKISEKIKVLKQAFNNFDFNPDINKLIDANDLNEKFADEVKKKVEDNAYGLVMVINGWKQFLNTTIAVSDILKEINYAFDREEQNGR